MINFCKKIVDVIEDSGQTSFTDDSKKDNTEYFGKYSNINLTVSALEVNISFVLT